MRRSLAVLPLAMLVSCDSGADVTFDVLGPFELDGAIAYLDRATQSLLVVDPSRGTGLHGDRGRARFEIGRAPSSAVSAQVPDDASRKQLLVVDPVEAKVHVVHDKRGSESVIELGVPLEALDVSPDGRYAIAYQPEGVTPTRSIFALQNTIAVVDLASVPPSAVTLQLASSSVQPQRAVFPRSLALATPGSSTGGTEVALGLLFVRGGVVPIDLAGRRALAPVPLTADPDALVEPAEVLFGDNEGDTQRGFVDDVERAFVRTSDGQLFVLSISRGAPSAGVRVALENVVTPDAYAHDAELYFDDDGNELLLVATGDELVLVDGYSGVARRFAIETWVDTLVRYSDPESGAAKALGYARGRDDSLLVHIDPRGLQALRSGSLSEARLAGPLSSARVAQGSARALLYYRDALSLGVMGLEGGDVLDLRFASAPTASRLDEAGEHLWLVAASPLDDGFHLVDVALGTDLATQEVALDASGTHLGFVGPYVFVDHGDPLGAITFFPRDHLEAEGGIAFRDLYLTDLLAVDVDDVVGVGGHQ